MPFYTTLTPAKPIVITYASDPDRVSAGLLPQPNLFFRGWEMEFCQAAPPWQAQGENAAAQSTARDLAEALYGIIAKYAEPEDVQSQAPTTRCRRGCGGRTGQF